MQLDVVGVYYKSDLAGSVQRVRELHVIPDSSGCRGDAIDHWQKDGLVYTCN